MQGLYDGNSTNLKNWLRIAPRKQITTLDTHDGIGVVDVADLMTHEEIERTKKNMFDRGANMSMRYNSAQFGNLDIYQVPPLRCRIYYRSYCPHSGLELQPVCSDALSRVSLAMPNTRTCSLNGHRLYMQAAHVPRCKR